MAGDVVVVPVNHKLMAPEALPHTPSGKVMKYKLREAYHQAQGGEALSSKAPHDESAR